MQPRVGRGRARLRSPLCAGARWVRKPREGRPVLGGAGRSLSAAGERRLLPAEGASWVGFSACPGPHATPQQPSASRGAAAVWKGEPRIARLRGVRTLRPPPELTHPCRPPRGRSCSRRYLREGGITVRHIPVTRPRPRHPSLYLGLRRVSLAEPAGLRPALASRARLVWIFQEQS